MTRLPHDWFPADLPANVEVGDGSWLYSSYAFLHHRSRRPVGVRIGRRTGVYIDTLFDTGPDAEIVVGDLCTLSGPVFSTRQRIVVGDRVLMSSLVTLADAAVAVPPGPDEEATGADPATVIVVEDDAWIGTGATLLAGAHVGAGAIVGAGTVVDFPVPARAIVAGSPARVVGTA